MCLPFEATIRISLSLSLIAISPFALKLSLFLVSKCAALLLLLLQTNAWNCFLFGGSINGAVAVREISEYEHACNILQLVPFAALRTHSRTCVCIYVTMNILAIHVRSYIAAICLSISQ